MKNKGFTLIELLAVIVILAIIALIATPIILNIIDNTKQEGVKRSIDHYMSAATAAIARANLNNTSGGVNPRDCIIGTDGNLTCAGTPITVEVDGEKPTGGKITFENGKITAIEITMQDGNTYELDEKGNVVLVGFLEGSGGGTEGGSGTEDACSGVTPVCTITQADSSKYTIGEVVECDVSTTPNKFYIMKTVDTSADSIKLLPQENIYSDNNLTFTGVGDNGKTVNQIINDYVNNLSGTLSGVSGKIPEESDVFSETAETDNQLCYKPSASQPRCLGIMQTGTFWIKQKSDTNVWVVMSSTLYNLPFEQAKGSGLGVRPVITMSTCNIQKQ